MRILVLLHGMPPTAGQAVVGSGLRAFANGEGLRLRGHEVCYCTRREDLPPALKKTAKPRGKEVRLDQLTDPSLPPGDPARMAKRKASSDSKGSKKKRSKVAQNVTEAAPSTGLAPAGGPMGAPGNPFSFTDTPELHDIVRDVQPDVVLVEAPEEARRLPAGNFKIVLDLFAPRILEQQFQDGAEEREAGRILDALQRGDEFLFSNERQRYYHLPLLALAGVDCTKSAGLVVPISCPPVMPAIQKPKSTVFVAGGVFWPWADLSSSLATLLETLTKAGKGKVHLYGGEYAIRSDTVHYADPREALPKKNKHLLFKGMVPIDTLWDEYRRASLALDLMAPNPEREINLSFRQIDYLRCGLPIITAPNQVIAEALSDYGAGWLVTPGDTKALTGLVESLLDDPSQVVAAGKAAQKLAADRFTWDKTIDALEARLDSLVTRDRQETVIARLSRTQGDLWEEHEENKRLRAAMEHLQDDQEKKSEEVRTLDKRLEGLLGSVDQLSDSLTAVSRFKNSALLYLQEEQGASFKEAAGLAEELERKGLDLKKKDDGLRKAQAEVAKLKKATAQLRKDNLNLERQYVERDQEVLALDGENKLLSARSLTLETELKENEGRRARELNELEQKKDREIEQQRALLPQAQREADRRRAALETHFAELEQKKDREIRQRDQALTRKDRQFDQFEAKAGTEADVQRDQFLRKLDEAESAARTLLEDAQTRMQVVVEDRGRIRSTADELQGRVRNLEKDITFKNLELNERAIQLREERIRLDGTMEEGQDLRDKLRDARVKLSGLEQSLNARDQDIQALRLDVERGKDALEQAGYEHSKLLEELDKKEREVGKAQTTRDKTKAKLEAAVKRLEEAVAKNEFELRTTLEESAKKDSEILEAQAERDNLKARLTADIENLEARLTKGEFEFRTLLEESSKKDSEVLEAQSERDSIKARLEAGSKTLEERLAQAEFEHRTLLEESAKKDGELEEANAERDAIKARLGADAKSLEERLARAEFEHRTLLEEFSKKEGEFDELYLAHSTLDGEVKRLTMKIAGLNEKLETAEFERQTQIAEVDKKTLELEDAHEQRDAIAAALQAEREFNANRGLLSRRKRPKQLPAGDN